MGQKSFVAAHVELRPGAPRDADDVQPVSSGGHMSDIISGRANQCGDRERDVHTGVRYHRGLETAPPRNGSNEWRPAGSQGASRSCVHRCAGTPAECQPDLPAGFSGRLRSGRFDDDEKVGSYELHIGHRAATLIHESRPAADGHGRSGPQALYSALAVVPRTVRMVRSDEVLISLTPGRIARVTLVIHERQAAAE